MSFPSLIREINEWQAATFGPQPRKGAINHFFRELKEAVEHDWRDSEEIADMAFLLCQVAHKTEGNLASIAFDDILRPSAPRHFSEEDRRSALVCEFFNRLGTCWVEDWSDRSVWLLILSLDDLVGMNYDSLYAVMRQKLAKNYARTWKAPDEHGVVEHVKEDA